MLNKHGVTNFDSLPESGHSEVGVAMNDFPDSVIYVLGDHADLLIAGESSECQRADLSAVQIQFLSNKVGGALEADLLPESQQIILRAIILGLRQLKDRSGTGSHRLVSGCATIGLIIGSDLVTGIKH